MKVIILCGGFGTRISEYTNKIPKPMIPIGNQPILAHIMEWYASYGHKDFFLALGYKADVIKDYFLKYRDLRNDFTIDLNSGAITPHKEDHRDWKVTLVDTGLNSMTGGRLRRLKSYIGDEPFMLTYGDGVANVDLDELLKFHKSHGKMVTVSAVHPNARFGKLELDGNNVTSFKEKPQTGEGWINGGFFVMQPEFLDLIEGDDTILEKQPLEQAAASDQMRAFFHEGYWHCMDTVRDHEHLQGIWKSGDAPWKVNG